MSKYGVSDGSIFHTYPSQLLQHPLPFIRPGCCIVIFLRFPTVLIRSLPDRTIRRSACETPAFLGDDLCDCFRGVGAGTDCFKVLFCIIINEKQPLILFKLCICDDVFLLWRGHGCILLHTPITLEISGLLVKFCWQSHSGFEQCP